MSIVGLMRTLGRMIAIERTIGRHVRVLAFALSVLATTFAGAAEWPDAPIRIYVPFTPGASTDVVVRTIDRKSVV